MQLEFFRYLDGDHYLKERYDREYGQGSFELEDVMDTWFNLGIAFVFPIALFCLNLVLYLIPLPAFVKAKFRE